MSDSHPGSTANYVNASFCIIQVNGQNVVGVKDKDISSIIEEGGQIVTVTVIPNFLYQHMMKK